MIGAFSVIAKLRMELFEALLHYTLQPLSGGRGMAKTSPSGAGLERRGRALSEDGGRSVSELMWTASRVDLSIWCKNGKLSFCGEMKIWSIESF